MTVTRRSLLKVGALSAAGPWAQACTSEPVRPAAPDAFRHGVASGDPRPDSVILWTRVSPPDQHGPVSGSWEVFDSLELRTAIRVGTFETDADRDFTVKVEATGLTPATSYYYRFRVEDSESPVGRTRTAPLGATDRLRLGVFCCASYAHGYFHAYRKAAERADLDAVVHLGDYIYEYGDDEYGSERRYEPPHELLTLEDYRRRYAQYRSDPDLCFLHQQHAMLAVWDDHEICNNAWRDGAENHQADEGSYAVRKRAAQQAYFEWMPIRESEPGRVHRSVRFGDLAQLVLADTRHWGRDAPISDPTDPAFSDPARSILGADQEAWLEAELAGSDTRWRLFAQQVMFSDLPAGVVNTDAWQGYPACRQRVLGWIDEHRMNNLIILSGDIHMSWALDVVTGPQAEDYDPLLGDGSKAVELVAPSVTSPSLERDVAERVREAALELPRIRLAQLWRRGYLLLDITEPRVQAEWYLFDRVDGPSEEEFYQAWQVLAGETFLRPAEGPAAPANGAPELAPS